MPIWSSNAKTRTRPQNGVDQAAFHRQQCMRRIAELEEEIRTVKESYNSLSPAYSLPPEILSTIFVATFARAFEKIDWDDKLYLGELQWMAATQVCQRWRQIALGCTELWSTLSLVNPHITALMLERSKQAPLTIDFCAEPDSRPLSVYGNALRKALSEVHRLRSVTYRQNGNYVDDSGTNMLIRDTFKEWTDAEASILESLYLRGEDIDPLPVPFLRGGAPVLKRIEIELIPCFPSLNGLHAPNLTYLSVDCFGSKGSPFPLPTPEDVMGTLSQFHRLEVLSLCKTLPPATEMASYNATHGRLQLASLRSLKLTEPMAGMKNFLAACQIPHNATVGLSGRTGDANPFDMQLVRQLFQELLFQGRLSPCSGRSSTGFKMTKLTVDRYCGNPHWQFWMLPQDAAASGRKPDLELVTPKHNFSLNVFLQCLRSLLDFSTLSTLTLFDPQDLSQAEWRRNFGELPLLKTIEVFGGTKKFFEALGRISAAEVAPQLGETTVCFPALSTLIVSRWYDAPPYSQSQFQRMARMLSDRSRAGLPIKHMVVEGGPPLEEEQYESLKKNAPETTVEWHNTSLS